MRVASRAAVRASVVCAPAPPGLRKSPSSCWPKRRGASAVEFALLAPFVFVFVLGMIEIGRAFMVSHQLAHAARVACRAGAIEGKSSAEVSSMASSTLSAQGISGAVIVVKVNGKVADSSTTVFGDTITVEATVPVSAVTWLPTGRFLSGQLARQYSMRRE